MKTVGWGNESIGTRKKASDPVDLDDELDDILNDEDDTTEDGGAPSRPKGWCDKCKSIHVSKACPKPRRPRKRKGKKVSLECPGGCGQPETLCACDQEGRGHPGGEGTDDDEEAMRLGLDLSSECPVCRSLDPCECTEEDRTFLRRVRWEDDVKKVARCPRCQAPLSVLYLPRPGARSPFRLPGFTAFWACALCHGVTLASAALGTGRARPHS